MKSTRLSRLADVLFPHRYNGCLLVIVGLTTRASASTIAPTQPVPVICQNPKEPRREVSLLRWGLIPSWAKEPRGAPTLLRCIHQ
ncbi:MAG: SOS response-associated peptidase family protein [Candidatus Sulfotelmatobacter sp.]